MQLLGIVALKTMRDRLAEDHVNAKLLGKALVEMGFGLNLAHVVTNIIIVDVSSFGRTAFQIAEELAVQGIKVSVFGEYTPAICDSLRY